MAIDPGEEAMKWTAELGTGPGWGDDTVTSANEQTAPANETIKTNVFFKMGLH